MSKVDDLAKMITQLALASVGLPKNACPDHSGLTEAIQAAIDERTKAVVGGRFRALELGLRPME